MQSIQRNLILLECPWPSLFNHKILLNSHAVRNVITCFNSISVENYKGIKKSTKFFWQLTLNFISGEEKYPSAVAKMQLLQQFVVRF